MKTPDPAIVWEPTRLEILRMVWSQELSAGSIAQRFPTTFGAVSQHLARLRDAGLVVQRRDGKRRLYRADRAALGSLADALERMWFGKLLTLKALAEAAELETESRTPGTPSIQTKPTSKSREHPKRSTRHARKQSGR